MSTVDVGSPDWWLARFLRKLGDRQERYDKLRDYAVGKHPAPNGDERYVQALRDLQLKAKTNYISLVLKAVTQRMRVKDFKFSGEVDSEAHRFWKANNMELQSTISIHDAATFSKSYALVSPPDDDSNGIPVITIEDPRCCIVEHDPVRPQKRLAGLKIYSDDLVERLVCVLYLPDTTYVYYGPRPDSGFDMTSAAGRIMEDGCELGGFELQETHPNPVGVVQLVEGNWQPETGFAECEDGAFSIQDRINHTMLDRLIITKAQAYRQRMVTGVKIPQSGPNKGKAPWDPGADVVWTSENKDAKVWDLEQADIKNLLEAIRDDIGDLAALTQTPVTYLTNRMVNVSGSALHAAQHSHVAKVRRRMDAMGWYFEAIIKLCFRYLDDERADEVDAEVQWADPEVRTYPELAELASKLKDTVPPRLIMEMLGFSAEEIERAEAEMERIREEERKHEVEVKEAGVPDFSEMNGGGNGKSNGDSGNGAKGNGSSTSKASSDKSKKKE